MTSSVPNIHRRRGRGQVLILMVPLLLVFFGFAALVIDLGIVRVTQARMTSAVDAAALEGLRWRDQLPPSAVAGQTPDQDRRAAAAALVGTIFAADDPAQPFDAGPQFEVQHATGQLAVDNDADAFAVVQPQANADGSYAGGYKPVLQLNAMNGGSAAAGNAIEGDLVSGTYAPALSHADGQLMNGQSAPYDRADLTADTAESSVPGLAMLARLRRSNETAEPGISSIGPPLPLLFGRGTTIPGDRGNPAAYDMRRDGLSVRAAAIANAVPVVSVGLPQPAVGIQGVVPVALFETAWETGLPATTAGGRSTPVPVAVVGDTIRTAGGTAGYLLATPTAAVTIGSMVTPAAALPATPVTGYFPILATPPVTAANPDPSPVVVGFGWATLDLARGTLTKLSMTGGAVAPWNASANLGDAWGTLAPLDAATAAFVRTANAGLGDPLLAAVGVRATDLPPSPN